VIDSHNIYFTEKIHGGERKRGVERLRGCGPIPLERVVEKIVEVPFITVIEGRARPNAGITTGLFLKSVPAPLGSGRRPEFFYPHHRSSTTCEM